jgi:uncharacterized protein YwgA
MDTAIDLTPRQEALLAFLGAGSNKKLDPICVQKGMFILAMETPEDWLPSEARYHFEPYRYGPYSPEIYYDLDKLEGYGYVTTTRVLGQSWNYYSLTPEGQELARSTAEGMDNRAVEYFRRLRNFVGELSFRKLLTTVYEHYPAYAINSVFDK